MNPLLLRWWISVGIGLVYYLVLEKGSVLVKASSSSVVSDDIEIRLGVTIRNRERLDRAPSCVHTFSRVELVNQNNAEVIIKSIDVAPEKTIRLDDFNLENNLFNNAELIFQDFSLPQQVVASKVNDNFVTLEPGQGAIVPLTFLPRFPPRQKFDEELILSMPSNMTRCQQADREQWIGSVSIRNNIGLKVQKPEIYRVTTELRVETNFGVARVPFDANSVRDNRYSLPDSIFFSTNAFNQTQMLPYTARNGIRVMNSFWNTIPHQPFAIHADCYDLYIQYPYDETAVTLESSSLLIQEIMVSRPENVTLEIIPSKDPNSDLLPTGPRHTIRQWNSDAGVLVVPADNKQHYLVTICTRSHGNNTTIERDAEADLYLKEKASWIDPTDTPGSLGFLQIRTHSETLFVSLLESSGRPRNESPTFQYHSQKTQSEILNNLTIPFSQQNSTLTVETPLSWEILVLAGTSGQTSSSFSLRNSGTFNITVMRTSILFKDSDAQIMEDLGIQLSLHPDSLPSHDWVIGPGQLVRDAFNVSTEWDKVRLNTKRALEFHGTILVQGSSTHKSSMSWMRAAMLDPSVELDLVVEIPFFVQCSHGTVAAAKLFEESSDHMLVHMDSTSYDVGVVEAVFVPNSVSDLRAVHDQVYDPTEPPLPILEVTLRIFTSVDTKLALSRAYIIGDMNAGDTEDYCDRFTVFDDQVKNFEVLAPGYREELQVVPLEDGLTEFGIVHLEYKLPTARMETMGPDGNIQAVCYLRVQTYPETGILTIPFYIYSGQLDVSVGDLEKGNEHNRVRSITGFPNLLDWFQTSKVGLSLRTLLISRKAENDDALLSRYMYGLVKSTVDLESSTLHPLLLNVGAINPDETEVFPVFITNYNPVSAFLRIDSGGVQGLRIALGRDRADDGDDLISRAPSIPVTQDMVRRGSFTNHPIEGLRQFLRSEPKARSTVSFPFRDAIYKSENAGSRLPLIDALFHDQFQSNYHKYETFQLSGPSGNCEQPFDLPQSFSKFMTTLRGKKYPGPINIATNSKSVRALSYCWNTTTEGPSESEASEIVIPPGGVARFDVTLHSPSVSLLDHDISQFLSTGLVITSANGIVIPVFVVFEVPRGRLEVSPDFGTVGFETAINLGTRAVSIPVRTFATSSPAVEAVVRIPPKSQSFDGITISEIIPLSTNSSDAGVPLYVSSSFNRPVELLQVSSCNPLFQVVLRNSSSLQARDPILGVHIGNVKNMVPCAPPSENGKPFLRYPSFYSCALDWILGRRDQILKCGPRLPGNLPLNVSDPRDSARLDPLVANRAFIRVLFLSAWSLGDGPFRGERRPYDGTVSPALVDAVAKAWDTWRLGEESNLLRLSTTLRAVISYNSSGDDNVKKHPETQVLSLSMGTLTINSVLQMPKLTSPEPSIVGKHTNDQVLFTVEFPGTYVGEVSSQIIRVSNPTSTTVRVRLARAPPLEEFENYGGKDALKTSTDLRNEFLRDHEMLYTQSGLKAQSSLEYMSQQWWDGSGSYFMSDVWGGLVRSHFNITVRAASGALVSLLSPGLLSNVAFIAGCGARCGIKDEIVKFDGPQDVRLTSFIGASAAEGFVLKGQRRSVSNSKHGLPIQGSPFRAAGSVLTGGKGPAPFSIPFFALKEEVEIPPFGEAELGPVLFRPPGRTKYMGCESGCGAALPPHCADTNFSGMLLLENSLTGLERVLLRGKALWERVIFQDVPSIHGEDFVSDIEVRNGRDALIFPGTAQFRPYGAFAVVKKLILKNDGDIAVKIGTPTLAPAIHLHRKSELSNGRICSLGEFTLYPCSLDHSWIHLKPGERFTFFIKHEPRCTQLSLFVALIVEYEHDEDDDTDTVSSTFYRAHARKGVFRKSREELLVGYKMDASELGICVPSGGHVVFGFLDTLDKLGLRRPEDNVFEGYGMFAIFAFALTYTCIILTVTASGLILIRKLEWRLTASSSFRKRLLGGPQMNNLALQMDSNWLATLRCLSRFDPSSQDLQALGREQTRLVLLNQFRVHGVLPPLCLDASGIFQRERSAGTRQSGSNSGIGSGGSERIRSLSDAIFKNRRSCFTPSGGLASFGAGWKTALSRGVIHDFTLRRLKLNFLTEELLKFRLENPSLGSEEESDDFDSSSSDMNEIESTDISVRGTDQNRLPTQSPDEAEQAIEDDSDSDDSGEDDDDCLSHDGSGFKVDDTEAKSPSDSNSTTSSLPDMSTSSFHSESAEYTKVTHKGKSSKKAVKPKASVLESGQNSASTSGAISNLANPNVAALQSTSTRAPMNRKESKRAAKKGANGLKLSAKAVPYEPKQSKASRLNRPPSTDQANTTPLTNESTPPQLPLMSLRPPPGLAPPPGFEAAPSGFSPALRLVPPPRSNDIRPANSIATTQESINAARPARLLYPQGRVPSPILGDDIPLSTTNTLPGRSALGDHVPVGNNGFLGTVLGGPTSSSHQNASDGFDIMDFLDGILNEGVSTSTGPKQNLQQSQITKADDTSLVPISWNPWAGGTSAVVPENSEAKSRALAYGINFDEDTSDRAEGSLVVDLPMLTPAAILGQQDESEEKNTLYSSFYSSLTK